MHERDQSNLTVISKKAEIAHVYSILELYF